MTLKEQHQDTVLQKCIDQITMINHIELLPFDNMQEWERREHTEILNDIKCEYEANKAHIIEHSEVFNNILCTYGCDVVVFFAKIENK